MSNLLLDFYIFFKNDVEIMTNDPVNNRIYFFVDTERVRSYSWAYFDIRNAYLSCKTKCSNYEIVIVRPNRSLERVMGPTSTIWNPSQVFENNICFSKSQQNYWRLQSISGKAGPQDYNKDQELPL